MLVGVGSLDPFFYEVLNGFVHTYGIQGGREAFGKVESRVKKALLFYAMLSGRKEEMISDQLFIYMYRSRQPHGRICLSYTFCD